MGAKLQPARPKRNSTYRNSLFTVVYKRERNDPILASFLETLGMECREEQDFLGEDHPWRATTEENGKHVSK